MTDRKELKNRNRNLMKGDIEHFKSDRIKEIKEKLKIAN